MAVLRILVAHCFGFFVVGRRAWPSESSSFNWRVAITARSLEKDKSIAALRQKNLEGHRWRIFHGEGQVRMCYLYIHVVIQFVLFSVHLWQAIFLGP
ncbi:unnamed protein product [Cuscuta campestris]|uniref:Secreted protein n=1 Tax=Cuscuta campestris TaxID=132261 RepID=A0A484MRP5_9ASTE|nr:unnamed protein product [Cuscuta campestris]